MKEYIIYEKVDSHQIHYKNRELYERIAKKKLQITERKYNEKKDYIEIIELNPNNNQTVEIIMMKKSKNRDNYQIWIVEINKKDTQELDAELHNFDEYETFKKVKLLLKKEEVELPITIEQHQENDYHSLTLKIEENITKRYHYNKKIDSYIQEKTKEEQNLIDILHQHILKPIEGEYLMGEEQERRKKDTKKELYHATKENPQLLKWLLTLENYEKEDSYGLYTTIEILCLTLLSEIDKQGEILYQISADQNRETYIRYRAIELLNNQKNKKQIKKLIHLLPYEKYEVFDSLLHAIANNHITEALEVINRAYPNSKKMEILETRAKLGDKSVLKEIIKIQNDPWYKKRVEKALKSLIEQMGENRALAQLHENYQTNSTQEQYRELYQTSTDDEIRYWAISRAKNLTSTESISILNDNSWEIQNRIAETLIESKEEINYELIKSLDNEKTENHAKHWILYILIKRGEEITKHIQKVNDIKITLPNYITERMREEIIRAWYKEAQPKTDIRWIIEGLLLEKESHKSISTKEEKPQYIKEIWQTGCYSIRTTDSEKKKENSQLEILKEEILKQNIEIKRSMEYAESMGTGYSSFDVITLADFTEESEDPLEEHETEIYNDELYISRIGNYALSKTKYTLLYKGQTHCEGDDTIEQNREKIYRKILEKAGYIYVSPKEQNFIFPKLNIYFFGKREPLHIYNLLFYWQD